MSTWLADEFVVHVRRLAQLPGSALAVLLDPDVLWTTHHENTARLLEVQAYRLDLEWASRTYDPNDPETKRAAALAKRSGEKPPKNPIVPPAALRPAGLAQQRFDDYVAAVTAHYAPPKERVGGRRAFDAAYDLD